MQELLSPDALEKVLAKEAKELTEADLDALISHLRADRQKFLQAEATGKKSSRTSPTRSTKSAELASLLEGLDLNLE